tara:strand:- start:2284 stop:2973 length:690 start_codon:yes stop_codon:yes gene_type:complete
MVNVYDNYIKILERVSKFYSNSNSLKPKPEIIAVSKTFGEESILPLLEKGIKVFGENKVQEAEEKWSKLKERFEKIELHLIGPLQSNKVKSALKIFDCIQTIDREKLVKKINNLIENDEFIYKKKIKYFIQVNTGNESQKSGVLLNEAKEFINWCVNDSKLLISGLMCIPPLDQDPEKHFKIISQLSNDLNIQHKSMGMTNDYEKALKYNATYIRVGSAIFGPRGVKSF